MAENTEKFLGNVGPCEASLWSTEAMCSRITLIHIIDNNVLSLPVIFVIFDTTELLALARKKDATCIVRQINPMLTK